MSAPALAVYQNGLNQVSGDQFNTFLQNCDNMAQLRGLVGVTGMKILVGGFTNNNDGGQGTFYWNASGTAADDNGVTTIVPSGAVSGEWTRLAVSVTGSALTSFSFIDANGITGSVANSTSTPALTLTLGNITPTSVVTGVISGTSLTINGAATLNGAFSATGLVTLSPAGTNVNISPTGGGILAIAPTTASSMDNVAIGQATPLAGKFTTLQATGAATFSPLNNSVVISPTGTGLVTINPATAGTLDKMAIGQTTPLAGGFTTITASGNITMTTAAKGLVLKQGANGKCGTFVANGATPVTVNNTSIAITDTIFYDLNTVGGTVGAVPSTKTKTAATGFTVACTAGDTSTYNYSIISNAA